MTKRAFKIDGTNTEMVISRVSALNTSRPLLYLEEMEDKTWRLTYHAPLFPDFSVITRFLFKGLADARKKKRGEDAGVQIKIRAKGRALGTEDSFAEWNIKKVITLPDAPNKLRAFYMDADPNNHTDWKLMYHNSLMPDVSKVTGISVVREG